MFGRGSTCAAACSRRRPAPARRTRGGRRSRCRPTRRPPFGARARRRSRCGGRGRWARRRRVTSPHAPMNVLVVIVNWRTPDLTVDCLRSLAGEVADVPGVRVVVTDNASGDGSVEKIRAAIDANGWTWASVLPLEPNGGYAYGNNGAIRPALAAAAKPDYIYLLNPDTIAFPGAVRELVDFMASHPKVGIAGGRAENRDGTVRRSVFRFHSVIGELENGLR